MENRIDLERRGSEKDKVSIFYHIFLAMFFSCPIYWFNFVLFQVEELNLDNCRSTTIVGLTDEYCNLNTLSLINVGITSLKGLPALPKLRKVASFLTNIQSFDFLHLPWVCVARAK